MVFVDYGKFIGSEVWWNFFGNINLSLNRDFISKGSIETVNFINENNLFIYIVFFL